MNDILYHIFFQVIELRDFILSQFYSRTLTDWLFFFFPLVILAEAPRYFLPAFVLPIMKIFNLNTPNTRAMKDFLKTEPLVSIIVAGRNEEKIIGGTIESLLSLPYKNKEIIVIDDASDDNMYEVCKKYADKGLIRLFQNSPTTGRTGRPVASNLGFRVSEGNFIISVDADTSYDYDIIELMIGPFYDKTVGSVAGNIKARNAGVSLCGDMQAIEYAISIGMWKRWTDLWGTTLQASGAFGAFRKEALIDVGGWDPELAEDADLSLKIKKSGWKIAFAPKAIAMTNVPEDLYTLIKQRIRWDKGALRTYYHKHGNIMKFWRFPFSICFEMAQEYLFIYVAPFIYAIYLGYMLWNDYRLFLFAYGVAYILYIIMTFVALFTAILYSERRSQEWSLLWYCGIFPFFKEIFRWVRLYANILETMRVKYEESYIPHSGYKDAPKW